MRRGSFLLALAMGMFLLVSPAFADILHFGDSAIYWPGYAATNDAYGPDNSRDEIGEPNLSAVRVESDIGGVKSIGIL